MTQIYLFNNNSLVSLKEKPIKPEEKLQNLIEKHPSLIPSSEIVSSPSFVILKREAGVSSGSIDLLLIDQYMVPTILETKVANPETRRKIVAQGLDYAASLTTEITGEVINDWANNYWGKKLQDTLRETLGIDRLDTRLINQNLERTRIRLIFAADVVPIELKRMVEFLNKSSRELEAYALEVRLFPTTAGDIFTVSIFGPTIREKSQKLTTRRQIDKDGLLLLAKEKNEKLALRIERLIDTAQENGFLLTWGTKVSQLRVDVPNGPKFKILEMYPEGSLSVDFQDISLRSSMIKKIYDQLDEIIDLQKVFQLPERKFGLGKKKLDDLTEKEFEELISLIHHIGNLQSKNKSITNENGRR